MTNKLRQVLSRIDVLALTKWLGPDTSELVRLLDKSLESPAKLTELLLGLRTEAGLLDDPQIRADLLHSLRQQEAVELVAAIGAGGADESPYVTLTQANFKQKKVRDATFAFFEVEVPPVPIVEPVPAVVECNAVYPLFSHQIDVQARTERALASEIGRALLHMPTGAGKTRTAMNLVANYLRDGNQRVAVWLAHSEELCDQAVKEFSKAWQSLGNRKINIYRFWGPHECDVRQVTDGIVVAGLPKLYARTKADVSVITSLATRRPFVVMDEAHQAIAQTYRFLLDVLVQGNRGSRLLGLSATPGRTWNDVNADQDLADFFGRQKVTLKIDGYANPVQYLIDQQYLARATYRQLECRSGVQLTEKEKKQLAETLELPETYLDRIGAHTQRSLQVIAEIERLCGNHNRIIVFAASVTQSDILATVLAARGCRAYSVTTNTSKEARARIIESYQTPDEQPFVLCNYGILTTGFDAPKTSAAVIARPTLSLVLYSQMVGRAIRGLRAGGNAEAEIVTVVDPGLPGFNSVESAFSNWEDVWRTE
ncbi:DEAD/DEAH box helicase [Noviherbaspirillum saxi]|uniref:DEAD/DEAH box helicase n=1 Tax=Noviherbaspirillum saxi TaxID=2320863 RepID=A0A3A3GET1_9BURK|nr:DEAD/DEAH box helicase family protein [Noviherbaspirillum saxi]RJF99419.1 DEAD/DEAH box helicase [Noviherbaspirillum saxi]